MPLLGVPHALLNRAVTARAHDDQVDVVRIASTLLGSVSRGILGESKRPVLIVRAATVAAPGGAAS